MTSQRKRHDRLRARWLSVTFVILAAIGALGASTAFWVNRSLLNTDRFIDMIQPVIDSDEVASATGDWIAVRLTEDLNLEDRIESSLSAVDEFIRRGILDLAGIDPDGAAAQGLSELPDLSDFSSQLTTSAETYISQLVADLVSTDAFRVGITEAIRETHRAAVVVLLENGEDLPPGSIVDGDVTLNLRPLIANAIVAAVSSGGDFLGMDLSGIGGGNDAETVIENVFAARGIEIPDNFGHLVVLSEDRLDGYRGAIKTFNNLVWFLIILTLLLGFAAIWTNPDRLAGTIWLGIGIVISLSLSWPITSRFIENVTNDFASDARSVVAAILEAASDALKSLTTSLIVSAVIMVGVAFYLAWRESAGDDRVDTNIVGEQGQPVGSRD